MFFKNPFTCLPPIFFNVFCISFLSLKFYFKICINLWFCSLDRGKFALQNGFIQFQVQFLLNYSLTFADKEGRKISRDIVSNILQRKPKMSNFVDFMGMKVVYKRYASLYFCCGVDEDENELEVAFWFYMKNKQPLGFGSDSPICGNFGQVFRFCLWIGHYFQLWKSIFRTWRIYTRWLATGVQ